MTAVRKPKWLAREAALLAMAGVMLTVFTSTAGANSQSAGKSGTVVVGALVTFTGVNAGYGPEVMAGCVPAVDLINQAGGVLGHKLSCQQFNTASDPVDAAPEARLMVSSTSNLLLAVGPGSTVASAVVPIVNAAHVPVFPSSGQSVFDKNNFPYYWRMVAIDVAQGYAMAAAAASLPVKRVAAVFDDSTSALGSQPGFIEGMKLLKRPVVDSLVLPPTEASYSSEIVGLLAKHPQLIVGELTAATAATFFTDLEQLNGGKMLNVLGDEPESEAPWQKAVSGAIGKSTMDKYVELVLPSSPVSSPAFKIFDKALFASNVGTKTIYKEDVYAASYYDTVNIVALAALEAKSIKASAANNYILDVANGVPGASVVHTFAEGKKLIDEGKKIRYVGASGPVTFPKYHNWQPPYNISRFDPNGNEIVVKGISVSVVSKLLTEGNNHVKTPTTPGSS